MTKPITNLECPNCGFVHGPGQNSLCTYSSPFVEPPSVSSEKARVTKSISESLFNTFGSDFSGATQDQRLLLLEAIAFCLRTGSLWHYSLGLICSRARDPRMPEACFPCVEIARNEGLKLLAALNGAIVEGYSVVAANERRI